jgi:hypothetical protein
MPSLDLRLLDRTDENGRPLWQLLEDYQYTIGVNTVITVPKGYITNFGTIPRCLFYIVAPDELREASVVHDFLCNENFLLDGEPFYSGFSRRVADAILYDHMRKLKIGIPRTYMVYFGVRLWAYMTGQV